MSTPPPDDNSLNLYKFVPGEPGADGTPPDLGQTEFIRRSAAETARENLAPSSLQSAEFGLSVKQMLGIITYCYVKGVFCSGDIAALLKDDPVLQNRFGRKLPDGEAIRRFRRRYATEIEEVLEDVLRRFPKDPPPGTNQTEFLQRKAADLLHDAAFTDSTKGSLG